VSHEIRDVTSIEITKLQDYEMVCFDRYMQELKIITKLSNILTTVLIPQSSAPMAHALFFCGGHVGFIQYTFGYCLNFSTLRIN
jgi:hypothetical protein